MDDSFLHEQRQEPASGFSRSLRERLRGVEEDEPARGFRLHPAFATALAVVVLAASFSLPAVRVAAQNALDLFGCCLEYSTVQLLPPSVVWAMVASSPTAYTLSALEPQRP